MELCNHNLISNITSPLIYEAYFPNYSSFGQVPQAEHLEIAKVGVFRPKTIPVTQFGFLNEFLFTSGASFWWQCKHKQTTGSV